MSNMYGFIIKTFKPYKCWFGWGGMLFIDRLLEAALDEITVDVTRRQCRVNGAEVERLAAAVASSARALIELQRMCLIRILFDWPFTECCLVFYYP